MLLGRLPIVVLVSALAWASAGPVQARREVTLDYPYSRVWTAAVRLMRVDYEATITEKDKDDGYFLFEYPDRGKSYAGSMELVAVTRGEHESVRVVLTIQQLPSYVETMIVDRLTRKLDQEFGPPRDQKPPPDSGSKDDADAPEKNKPPAAPKAKPDSNRSVNRDDTD
ncbi:MAG: hypothetical protein ABW321_09875 [Polyangiales bacterium]